MKNLLLVCAGGALGSGARYLVGVWAVDRFGRDFPWGTLAVNVAGCFLIAVVLRFEQKLSHGVLLALTTGVMGGFTTYSAFNMELLRMLHDGRARQAALYVAATLVGCFAAGAAGWAGAKAAAG